jgi:hypothetical protein
MAPRLCIEEIEANVGLRQTVRLRFERAMTVAVSHAQALVSG